MRDSLRYGRRTLAAGQSREIGLYDLEREGSLPGLRRVIILAVFQMEGVEQLEIERLYREVR